jgi:hypothetical protein
MIILNPILETFLLPICLPLYHELLRPHEWSSYLENKAVFTHKINKKFTDQVAFYVSFKITSY